MASHFDRWEKDPFFSAAEEVQESADRMESTYRTWIHALKDTSGSWNCDALRRDLRTTLGTAKWQLEEFDRAVRSSYNSKSADDARDRHHEFFIAIDSQIKKVENSLNESAVSQGKPPLPWVRLDEGEVDELAAFLSGPSTSSAGITHAKVHGVELQIPKWEEAVNQSLPECSENPLHSEDGVRGEAIDEKFLGHRRTASASADIGAWQIALGNDISIKEPAPPPRRIPSYQGLLNAVESVKELKWPKNGYRKLKFNQEAGNTLPRTQPPTRNINTCYDRNKSCLDGCDDCYDKQLYGWYGAVQRQLQRSQYYMQYRRPVRIVFSVFLLIFLIGEFANDSCFIYLTFC
uniref:T-snare n=1 Tax=Solanum tuberosum TaxID=4113 RepID=M1BXW1_SOLTU